MIRAKFRVIEHGRYLGLSDRYRLRPVCPTSKDDPANDGWIDGEGHEGTCEENAQFWKATPSGEITLCTPRNAFAFGRFYYVDMEERPDGEWRLRRAECLGSSDNQTLSVELDLAWDSDRFPVRKAKIELGIANTRAFAAFEGKAGTAWSVTFTEA